MSCRGFCRMSKCKITGMAIKAPPASKETLRKAMLGVVTGGSRGGSCHLGNHTGLEQAAIARHGQKEDGGCRELQTLLHRNEKTVHNGYVRSSGRDSFCPLSKRL